MDYNIWFWIIIGILIFNFALTIFLNYLNIKNLKSSLPEEVSDIYDSNKYEKSQQYTKTNTNFSFITGTFSFIVIILMLFLGGFNFFDKLAIQYVGDTPITTSLFFFFLIYIGNELISLPFSIYDTFVIEKKFGFNKTTKKTFIADFVKSFLLTILLGGGILALLIYFYNLTQAMFWIYAWALITFFSIFMSMFYSNLIVPLFNKQTPLEDGELRTAIFNFSQKAGFELKNIFVINGSKRSTKANAYFSGLGPKKRIVLYDTLIEQLTVDELVAVLAHEIGHYKKKHTLKSMFFSIINTGIILYIFSLIVKFPEISIALGAEKVRFHIAIIAFMLLFSPISLITGLIMNIFSRKNEFQADNFAKNHGFAENLISGLKKLSVNNLSNLQPHRFFVFFNYSHPPLLERIKNLRQSD